MWYIYILECQDSSYYTGITSDLIRRIIEHQNGNGARYTKGRLPVKLKYYETKPKRSDALKRESKIKKYTRSKKIELINSYVDKGYQNR
jgi:putative endonuclease